MRNLLIVDKPTYSGYTAWRGIGTSDSKRINIYLGPGSHVVSAHDVNLKEFVKTQTSC